MTSAKFLWENVGLLLGGKQQVDAINLNFEIFESALYMESKVHRRFLNLNVYKLQTAMNNSEIYILLPKPRSLNCFTRRTLYQNGANDISEMISIVYRFLSKRSTFCIVKIFQFCSNFAGLW